MILSVNIPHQLYRQLMLKADGEGLSLQEIMLRGVEKELARERSEARRFEVPVIPSANPGSLNLTNKQIEDTIDSPE